MRPIYERDNPGDVVSFGGWARLDGGYRLKPDILNHTKQRFVEIKPLSLSGLVAGGIQMQIYTVIFGMSGYLPHIEWFPSENLIFVQGQPVTIVNVGGLLLYTDEQRLFEEFGVLTTLAAAKELLALRAAGEFARIAQLARLATSAAQVGLETETTLACATARF